MEDNVKKKGNNKLLVALVSVMSIVMVGVLGVILYKGYASESVDSSIFGESFDDSYDGYNYSYYNDVTEYLNTYVAYVEKVYPVVLKGNMTDVYKEDVIYRTNEFMMYSQSFTATPITAEDDLLYDNFFDFKLSAENFADYVKSYVFKEEKVYLDFMKNSFKDTEINIDTIAQIEKTYYK